MAGLADGGAQSALTVNDLQDMLTLCQTNRVAVLKFGVLEITLHERAFELAEQREQTGPVIGGAVAAGKPTLTVADEEALRDLQETQELIDNPAGYEQSVIDGHMRQDAASNAQARRSEAQRVVHPS